MALSSWPLEPEEVKRREYFGISVFILGLICLIAGLVALAFMSSMGVAFLATGTVASLTGPYLLTSIPIVAALPESSVT